MNSKEQDIVEYLNDVFPNVTCELNYENDLQLLIAVLLSAQTTDKAVNKVTEQLFKDYPTCNDLIKLDIAQIQAYIRRLGLYQVKSKNVYNLVNIINNDYACKVPNDYDALVALPGVGRKTANVVLAEYFKVPAIAVDTHVERISKRLKLAFTNDSVLKVEKKLMQKFPKDSWIKLHHQFIHFGRYICKAQNPECEKCRLQQYCRHYNKQKAR